MGHTKGSWSRNIEPATKYNTIFAGRNTHVCYLNRVGLTPEEVEANCNLIVAAPAMLAALDAIVKKLPAEELVATMGIDLAYSICEAITGAAGL
jgi:hypothetical protein